MLAPEPATLISVSRMFSYCATMCSANARWRASSVRSHSGTLGSRIAQALRN
ncbi:MAG: hypothetical protein ACJ79A_19515 [Gemmatimonadaceae bacterium]